MNAKDLIKAAKLSDARGQLIEAVKSSPADLRSRTLLFQVLAYSGEWKKARHHLEIIASQDSSQEIGVQVYLNLVQAETDRLEVWQQKRRPSFLPDTPEYFERYETAWLKLVEKNFEEARAVFKELDAQGSEIAGTLNGKNFIGFKDTDSRMSYLIEAFVHELYVWLPLETLRELILPEPKTLFDLLWTSAQITTWEGLTLNCFLPTLYPESFLHEDDQVKLGRMSDWLPLGGGFFKGIGQRVFQVGEEEIGILEIREAIFNPPGLE